MSVVADRAGQVIEPVRRVLFFGFNRIVADVVARLGRLDPDPGIEVVIVADPTQAGRRLDDGNDLCQLAAGPRTRSVVIDDLAAPELDAVVADMTATVAISVGAPWFFGADFIDRLDRRILNLHGTHLPRDRGAAIFSWMLLRGQRTGLCQLHRLVPRLDAGEPIRYREFLYPVEARSPGRLMAHYDANNAEFVTEFIVEVSRHGLVLADHVVVPDYLSSYWPRLDAQLNGWIDWDLSAVEIERFVCAFDEPYGGARTLHDGREVVLRDVYAQSADGATHPYQRGIVYRKNDEWLTVATTEGELLVRSLCDTEGNDVASSIKVGDRLRTPRANLEDGLRRPTRDEQLAPDRP